MPFRNKLSLTGLRKKFRKGNQIKNDDDIQKHLSRKKGDTQVIPEVEAKQKSSGNIGPEELVCTEESGKVPLDVSCKGLKSMTSDITESVISETDLEQRDNDITKRDDNSDIREDKSKEEMIVDPIELEKEEKGEWTGMHLLEAIKEDQMNDVQLANDAKQGGEQKEEEVKEKQSVKEESVKEESVKEESVKEESVKEESVKEESVKEESVKEESVKQESVKQESVKQESVKQESVKQESVKQESVKQESVKQESVKQEEEKVSNGSLLVDEMETFPCEEGEGKTTTNLDNENPEEKQEEGNNLLLQDDREKEEENESKQITKEDKAQSGENTQNDNAEMACSEEVVDKAPTLLENKKGGRKEKKKKKKAKKEQKKKQGEGKGGTEKVIEEDDKQSCERSREEKELPVGVTAVVESPGDIMPSNAKRVSSTSRKQLLDKEKGENDWIFQEIEKEDKEQAYKNAIKEKKKARKHSIMTAKEESENTVEKPSDKERRRGKLSSRFDKSKKEKRRANENEKKATEEKHGRREDKGKGIVNYPRLDEEKEEDNDGIEREKTEHFVKNIEDAADDVDKKWDDMIDRFKEKDQNTSSNLYRNKESRKKKAAAKVQHNTLTFRSMKERLQDHISDKIDQILVPCDRVLFDNIASLEIVNTHTSSSSTMSETTPGGSCATGSADSPLKSAMGIIATSDIIELVNSVPACCAVSNSPSMSTSQTGATDTASIVSETPSPSTSEKKTRIKQNNWEAQGISIVPWGRAQTNKGVSKSGAVSNTNRISKTRRFPKKRITAGTPSTK